MQTLKIGVIGGGAWGTALAAHCARQGHDVRLWAREPEVAASITQSHENVTFLPGERLPEGLAATTDPAVALDGADTVLLVPPSKYFRQVVRSLGSLQGADVLVATKGFDEDSLQLMTDVLVEESDVPVERVGVISGPSFAKEVAQGLPTNVVIASTAPDLILRVQSALHHPRFRLYSNPDPIGVQVGGALKNVFAVATGCVDGLGLGYNGRAAVITRGLAELTRLGVALGANPLTFLGMAGVGDLILTCTGDLSRNRQLGLEVAKGADPAEYLRSKRSVAEGFWTAKAAYRLSTEHGVEMPITTAVYQVLHEGVPLRDAAEQLMEREYKDELYGIRDVWSQRVS